MLDVHPPHEKIGVFQGQLLLVEVLLKSLDGDYQHFLAADHQ